MKKINQKLVELYQQMYEMTLPECKSCRVPLSCCDEMYCRLAEDWAAEFGVKLEPTGHPTLKFMGQNGCTVPPHFRPNCTLHTCDMNSLGFKRKDLKWTEKYFELRERINQLEQEQD